MRKPTFAAMQNSVIVFFSIIVTLLCLIFSHPAVFVNLAAFSEDLLRLFDQCLKIAILIGMPNTRSPISKLPF